MYASQSGTDLPCVSSPPLSPPPLSLPPLSSPLSSAKKIIIICNCAVELAMDYKLNHTFKLYAQVSTPICQLSGSRTIISEFSVM